MSTAHASSRSGRCWYCGKKTLREGDPPEHIIPAAIGGALTTDRVCKDCNHAASKIDQRFVQDYFIGLERNRHEVPDRKGAPPPHVRQKVVGRDDGKPYRINTRGGRFELEPVAQVREDGEGNFNASAATEEEALRAAERKLGDLKSRGFKINEVQRLKLAPMEVAVSITVRPIDHVRAAAKMTLGALSLVWPDEWLDSPDAKRYQGWLRDAVPTDDEGNIVQALAVQNQELLGRICDPPEHAIILWPHGDATQVMIVLFGTMILALPAATGGLAQPRNVWRMNPLTRSLDEMDLDALLTGAVLRANGGQLPQFDFDE